MTGLAAEQPFDFEAASAALEGMGTADVLRWAWSVLGPEIAATSSFQTQSLPLLHVIAVHTPEMPVLFLDTGFHFPETLEYRDRVAKLLGLNLVNVRPDVDRPHFDVLHGELYSHDPDRCCYLNKVRPLESALEGLAAWVTGVRRDQTTERSAVRVLSLDGNGRAKVAPMAYWTQRDVFQYISDQHLPEHPLLAEGYLSIGCAPCTRPSLGDGDPRSGRWAGTMKTECGIHTSGILKPGSGEGNSQ